MSLGIPKEIAQGVKAQKVAFSMSKLPEVASLGMPKVLLTFGSPKNAQNFDFLMYVHQNRVRF